MNVAVNTILLILVSVMLTFNLRAQTVNETIEYTEVFEEAEIPPYHLKEPYLPEYREIAPDEIAGQKNRKEFSYAKDPQFWERYKTNIQENKEAPKKEKKDPKIIESQIIKILGIIIIGVLLALLIMHLIKNAFAAKNKTITFASDEPDDEPMLHKLDEQLASAVDTGNYRQAVRILYLMVLKKLDDNDIINFKEEYTNDDYKKQLQNSMLLADFNFISRSYEYVWYGEIPININQFENLHQKFNQFKTSI